MSRRVYKYEVPVDDQWHGFWTSSRGPVLAAACQVSPSVVTIWLEDDDEVEDRQRDFRVYGTGHPIEEADAGWAASVTEAGGGLVWHVYEKP